MEYLSLEDLNFILESLKYTKLKFEDYGGYPSYEYKQQRLREVAEVMTKVYALKQHLASNKPS